MGSALDVHRLQFAFTVTYHYLFPQLTMGLALLLVILKTLALRTGDEHYNRAARFWAKIFGINFALGVVTGIPMEFQFGTNWAEFSKSAGGVIGQTLAMEGVFSFFLESSFLGLFLYGEKRLGRIGHWCAAFLVFLGSWLSGYFIVATDAWMQHPTGYRLTPGGGFELTSFWGLLLNPWALAQYAHNMFGAVQTGCFVVAAVGAFYLLSRTRRLLWPHVRAHRRHRRRDCRHSANGSHRRFPGKNDRAPSARHTGGHGRSLCFAGRRAVGHSRPTRHGEAPLDNPLEVPRMLSFLTYKRWGANVHGLDAFPQISGPTKSNFCITAITSWWDSEPSSSP